VARNGVLTEAETLGDLAVRRAGGSDLYDFDFPFAKAGPSAALRNEASPPSKIIVTPSETSE
jgi:hypothetical protein